jgi:hypothetical protein
MNRLTILVFFTLISFLACKDKSTAQTSSDGIHFGEKIDTSGMITYDELLSQMAVSDTVATKVTGKVSGVCQAKGCWMNIVSDNDTTKTEMFVKFKDYGFFMPKDLAGKEIVMSGKAYREVTSVDELKHYAEDEGLSAEEIAKIIKPKTELKFMASGVIIK